MEHAFDFLFEHSWYLALAFYLTHTHGTTPVMLAAFIVLFDSFAYYFVSRHLERHSKTVRYQITGGLKGCSENLMAEKTAILSLYLSEFSLTHHFIHSLL